MPEEKVVIHKNTNYDLFRRASREIINLFYSPHPVPAKILTPKEFVAIEKIYIIPNLAFRVREMITEGLESRNVISFLEESLERASLSNPRRRPKIEITRGREIFERYDSADFFRGEGYIVVE